MCFSPKVKTPKATVTQTPLEPAPLKDDVAGIQFGGDSSATEDTGVDTVKIDKNTSSSDSNTDDLKNDSTSASDIKSDAATVGKTIKRKDIFGGKK